MAHQKGAVAFSMRLSRVSLKPLHLAACLAGIVAGLGIFIVGVAEWRDNTELLASGLRAEARVIEIHKSNHGDRVTYEFRAHRPGTREVGRYRALREPIGFAAADRAESTGRVEIAYDPANPEISRAVDSGAGWGYAAILVLVLCLIGYPVYVLLRDLSWRREVLQKGVPGRTTAPVIFRLVERRTADRSIAPVHGPSLADRSISIRMR
jgi:hypothetical protein